MIAHSPVMAWPPWKSGLVWIATAGMTASAENLTLQGPDFISFESGVPTTAVTDERSSIQTSGHRFLIGHQSLQWDWQESGSLQFNQPVKVEEGTVGIHAGSKGDFPAHSMFAFWIYNERPLDQALYVEFGSGPTPDCHFEMGMDFTGWRTAWVRFIDMEGTPKPSMDWFRFSLPTGVGAGRFFLDAIAPSTLVDAREPVSDYHVQARAPVARINWRGPEAGGRYPPATAEEVKALAKLETRIHQSYLRRQDVTDQTLTTLRERFASFDIVREGDSITGRYVPSVVQGAAIPPKYKELFEAYNLTGFVTAGTLLQDLAFAYHSTESNTYRGEIEQMFLDLSFHLLDQGWAEGHIHGTNHHFGYSSREYYRANFLMRQVLSRAGLLTRIARAMEWLQPARKPYAPDNGISMDYLRTESVSALSTVLTTEDVNGRAYWTRELSQVMGATIANVLHTHDQGIKRDGTAFHHWGHYPAYSVGGLEVGTTLFRWFADTPFRFSPEAYRTYASALLAQRIFMNGSDVPNGIAGRHPFRTRFELDQSYLNMALAGTATGDRDIDPVFAAAYLRVVEGKGDAQAGEHFAAAGIRAEPTPSGHWTFPCANLNIHRRDEWMVSLKGYGKYVWASEIYSPINRFGRNQSNGAIEIYNRNGQAASGYREDGWDWNRIPGTTTLHLPWDQLLPTIDVTMHYSTETFVGGAHLRERNGVFGMVLNESQFGHRLAARKSAFCFDNRVICLGTDIRSDHPDAPVETTLFQNSLPDRAHPTWLDDPSQPLTSFPHRQSIRTSEAGSLLGDAYGNAYYLPAGQDLNVSRSEQVSEDSHELKKTRGDMAVAWLDHGRQPAAGRYEYVILVQSSGEKALDFARSVRSADGAPYTVREQSSRAHIVYDRSTDSTGYALFEAGDLDDALVASVSAPCFVMTESTRDGARLSLADPDLHMQATAYPAKLPGEYRLDHPSPSPTSRITLTLNGSYRLVNPVTACRITECSTHRTTLEFTCRFGQAVEIELAGNKSE